MRPNVRFWSILLLTRLHYLHDFLTNIDVSPIDWDLSWKMHIFYHAYLVPNYPFETIWAIAIITGSSPFISCSHEQTNTYIHLERSNHWKSIFHWVRAVDVGSDLLKNSFILRFNPNKNNRPAESPKKPGKYKERISNSKGKFTLIGGTKWMWTRDIISWICKIDEAPILHFFSARNDHFWIAIVQFISNWSWFITRQRTWWFSGFVPTQFFFSSWKIMVNNSCQYESERAH